MFYINNTLACEIFCKYTLRSIAHGFVTKRLQTNFTQYRRLRSYNFAEKIKVFEV